MVLMSYLLFQSLKMVKLYALTVLYKSPTSAVTLKAAYDVESFSFFQRNSIKEFMCFVSKTIVERTQTCARQSVKEGGNCACSGMSEKLQIVFYVVT